jgi:hypothetical protein
VYAELATSVAGINTLSRFPSRSPACRLRAALCPCSVRAGKAFLVRPPDGICGVGITTSPIWPAKVSTLDDGT